MSAVINAVIQFFNNLIGVFSDLSLWLQDLLLYIPKWIFHEVSLSIVTAINWVFSLLPSYDFSLAFPNSVAYFLGPFHVGMGLSIVVGAYILRFVIRRIPVIG